MQSSRIVSAGPIKLRPARARDGGEQTMTHRLLRAGGIVLGVVALHAAVTAVLRLHGALDALLFVPDAPIDLLIRTDEVLRWFRGVFIYTDAHSANYPPASYTLLWPVLGWLPESLTRMLFGLTLLVAVLAIALLGVRVSGARGWGGRAFIGLLVLPLGATQITVWIGQLGLHVVACLLGAGALLFGTRIRAVADLSDGSDARASEGSNVERPTRANWTIDLSAAALLAVSLVKPTLSAPIVVAIWIAAGRWRPALLTTALYAGLTLIAAAFQDASPVHLMLAWLGREPIMNLPLGSVNTHLWLHWLGVGGSKLVASLLWLLALMLWTWRHRTVDPWLIVAVAALVGRLWIHHRAFDDVLLVVPAIVLFRIAAQSWAHAMPTAITASLLVALIYGFGHAPWSYLSGENHSKWLVTEVGRTIVWMATLIFLLVHARRQLSIRGRRPATAALPEAQASGAIA
jgi:hypothetical protein